MVYKKEKHHVRSGNTLRTPNTRQIRLYRRQSYLVRQSTEDINSDVLDDLGFDNDNVGYSLNKKGRWLVPQILTHELTNSDDDVKMDLVESHRLKRKAKYTTFHSNDGCLRKVSPKKTYFDLSSVRCKTTSPKVTISIEKACPRTSSLACNPKYLDFTPTHNGNEDFSETDPKESTPKKNRTRTQRPKTFMRMAMDEYQDESDYSDNEDYDLDLLEDNYNPRLNNVCVGDILLYSNDMQGLLFRELDKSITADAARKPHDQHPIVEEDENEATGQYSEILFSFTAAMTKHINILLPNTEVLTGRLEEVFGEDYIECRCFPRKFIIDITEKVTSTILKSKAFLNRDMKRADLSAVVVFAYDMFGSIETADIDSFKVSINMMSTNQCLKTDYLSEMSLYGIEEVIQRVVSYIGSMPCENFMLKDVPSRKTEPAKLHHSILNICSLEVTVLSPENIPIKDILKKNRKKMGNVDLEILSPDVCSICFESILESPATALQTCGHWFCDQCWNDHVIATASSSTSEITCPEYKCQSIVDYDILLTISNMQTVEQYFRRQINRNIMKDQNSKWCPNTKCGRVVKCDMNKAGQCMNVKCKCGTKFCFECLHSVHWPLSCKDLSLYLTQLQEDGSTDNSKMQDQNTAFTLKGKRCPMCNNFVQKNGGCLTVPCICGESFCWGCLKPMNGHVTTDLCRSRFTVDRRRDMLRTREVVIFGNISIDVDREKSDWFKRAVLIRARYSTSFLKVMSSAVRTMCRAYKRRTTRVIGEELENFEASESTKYVPIMEKIHPFLTSMISVYLEMSHLCENTAMYQEKTQRDPLLTQTLNHLERVTKEIYTIFRDSNNVDLKFSISRLFQLRIECDSITKLLVDALN